MSSEHQKRVDDAEFMDVARDPGEARALRKSLEMIARGGAGDTLKEMAQDVLTGRIGLRQAAQTAGYTDALIEKSEPFQQEWNGMSEAERHARAAEGERALENERREIAEERRAVQGQNSHSAGRHSGGGWSLY
ncbi:hypothetical protein [Streptomyces sp. NPDC048196]|uniref:hypothetical protein n=1 Tax=Streptomyces sp. NPDC048196 TaxID=3154712 RepID=UPI0033E90F58